MKLNKIQMQEFLAAFHINDTIAAWDELVHIEFFSGASFVLKQYFRVHTKKKSYILKMLSLPMCSKEVLERQSEISEFYRMNGVPTPKRFQSKQGTYLWTWNNGKYEIDISIEEDFGDMISVISEETIDFMGHLLGKMHALSITNDCHFRLGSLYSEFCKGDVDYLKLWNRTGTDFLPKDLLDEILRKYYRHMDIVKSVWQTLPRYTVQADVYRMNMLIKNEECSIIDYDRAGDESGRLRCDFRVCQYLSKAVP